MVKGFTQCIGESVCLDTIVEFELNESTGNIIKQLDAADGVTACSDQVVIIAAEQ